MFGKDGFLVDIYMTQQQHKFNSGNLAFSAWYAQLTPPAMAFELGN